MTIADLDRALDTIERALLDSSTFVIASGLLSNCEAIISNDAGWRRLASLFPQFRWIYLGDYL